MPLNTKRRWRNRLALVAEVLEDLFKECPFCDHARGGVDCPRCAVVWHHAQALHNFALQLPVAEPLRPYHPERRGA